MSRRTARWGRDGAFIAALAGACLALAGGAAGASASTFCVKRSHCHGVRLVSVRAAVRAAERNGPGRDRILIGPGRFVGRLTDARIRPTGSGVDNVFDLIGVGDRTHLVGAPSADPDDSSCAFAFVNGFSEHRRVGTRLRRLRVSGDCLALGGGSSARQVTLHGTLEFAHLVNFRGATFSRGRIRADDVGVSAGAVRGLVEDTRITAPSGVVETEGGAGHGSGARVNVRRVRIAASRVGVSDVQSVSDSTIVMHRRSTGVYLACAGGGTSTATNLTVLGDGSAGSTGAMVRTERESGDPYGCFGAHLKLRNSIVRGFATSLRESRGGPCREPGENQGVDCAPGQHEATVLAASYSDFDPSRVRNDRPVSVDAGHNVNVDPHFVNRPAGDFRLHYASPLIDRGSGRSAGALDLGRHARSVDAHRVGDGIVDMGAFEYQGTGPRPAISAPRGVRAGRPTILSGSRSSDPDGGGLTYNWHFGDGTASADGRRVSHVFHRPGRFRVYLRVTNYAGRQAFTSRVIRITR